ncbi:Uncharacterised protein [Providencia stuartii]|nr:Uncharacterised protein [Providencia stuartii]
MKPEHLALLRDKLWRLNHLYWITNKEGKPVRFKMTPEHLNTLKGCTRETLSLKPSAWLTTEVALSS